MTEDQMFDSFSKIFSKKELDTLEEYIIYKSDKNQYNLHGEYTIKRMKDKFVIHKLHTYTTLSFSSLRNAVIWTSLDKRNHITEANRVVELDSLLYGAMASEEVHKRLAGKAKDIEAKVTYLSKLQEDTIKRTRIQKELNDYAKNTTNWQYKRFKQVSK